MAWGGRWRVTPNGGNRRWIEQGGFLVPPRVMVTCDAENGDPDITAQFEYRDGRPECVGFFVRSKPKGRGIRTADLGVINIDGLTGAAFSWAAAGTGGTPLTGPRPDQPDAAREIERARKGRPRTANRAELERVAQV